MAGLPPDGDWLVQNIDGNVVVYHRHTEEEIVKYPASDDNAMCKAQGAIHNDPRLTDEQKCFAHFWCGYFHAYLGSGNMTTKVPDGD